MTPPASITIPLCLAEPCLVDSIRRHSATAIEQFGGLGEPGRDVIAEAVVAAVVAEYGCDPVERWARSLGYGLGLTAYAWYGLARHTMKGEGDWNSVRYYSVAGEVLKRLPGRRVGSGKKLASSLAKTVDHIPFSRASLAQAAKIEEHVAMWAAGRTQGTVLLSQSGMDFGLVFQALEARHPAFYGGMHAAWLADGLRGIKAGKEHARKWRCVKDFAAVLNQLSHRSFADRVARAVAAVMPA